MSSGKKNNQTIKILHADDEEAFRSQVSELLQIKGYAVDVAVDGVEAINALQHNGYDIVLLDINMPKVDGLEVLRFIKERYPVIEVIMLTGVGDVKVAVDCMIQGAYNYIVKPFMAEELLQVISRAVERHTLLFENSIMKSEINRLSRSSDLVGESESFKNMLSIAERVADAEASVLIQGQSGTGKELVANFIHKRSSRANRPMVAINCAAIPDTLLESELFGHEKGAFTDARAQKQGLIELANNGTLFLDEVGDISPIIQPKLLRFVQTGEFRRIGGTVSLHADVRIISATNKDLKSEVQENRFREDLLYRINVITLVIPPLKDRKTDIPLLVDNFMRRKFLHKTPKLLDPQALDILMEYEWPGNIRELENVLESAVILSRGEVIQPSDIMLPHSRFTKMKSAGEVPGFIGELLSLKDTERLHIQAIMKHAHGDKKVVAKILGISLKTLYTKIAQYQLS
jgi:DNA-binding NtrC family response regulator